MSAVDILTSGGSKMVSSREYDLIRKLFVVMTFFFVIGLWLLYYSLRPVICATTHYCEFDPFGSPIRRLDAIVVFFGLAMMLMSLIIHFVTGGEN